MTTRSQPNLPATLPATACVEMDLFRDYVGDGRDYRGHNGECTNCGATFSEAEDSDLATAHWTHRRAVARAIWERDEPADVRELALLMDPDDPMDATEHAHTLLRTDWVAAARAADARRCNERQRLSLNATLDRLISDELDAGNTERAAALRSLRAWNRGAAYVIPRGAR